MNSLLRNRRFWVRSCTTEGAEVRTPVWAIKTLTGNYPGLMGTMSAYYATLRAGHTPHDMHTHAAEEIILVRSGDLDVETSHGQRRVEPGGFFYVPPGAYHTVRAVGPESTHLVVFKWTPEGSEAEAGPVGTVTFGDKAEPPIDQPGIWRRKTWDGWQLAAGGTLVAEAIRLAPHTGYPAHSHDHDLMLVLLRGRMHALGHTTDAPAIIYYPAGMVHALAPLSDAPVELRAFEFHRPAAAEPSGAQCQASKSGAGLPAHR